MLLGGHGVVKRGKREDFGQNGGSSWDLYRPSRDQRQERIPGGSTPRSAGHLHPHPHTLWLTQTRTHSLTPLPYPTLQAQAQAGPGWRSLVVLAVSPAVVSGLSCLVRVAWIWSGLVPGPVRGGVPLLFF